MKKFIIKIIITIAIPVLVFFIIGEMALREIPNDYSYKNHLLEQKANKIKILNLGSSHGYYGINPYYFALQPAFNAAHVSQSYKYDNFIFNKFINRMDSLKYVILTLSSFSPYSNLEDGTEKFRITDYVIYYKCSYHRFEPEYNFKMYYLSLGNLLRIKNSIIGKINDIHIDNNGYSKKTSKDRINDFNTDGIIAAKRHTIHDLDINKTKENIKYVQNIIDICKSKNIYVILVTTPTCKEYYSHLNPKQIKIMENFGNKFVKSNNNVIYINLLKSNLFNENDFFNSDHLCDKGARKLTLILNDTIMKLEKRKL
jgi:hypothetical protein